MPTWNASQYLQFADQRTRPCRELVARIRFNEPKRIVDLGCGPGNSTAVLRERWPTAEIVGVDSSSAMIAAAKAEHPHGHWEIGDIASWSASSPVDLVFSNAAVHWVDDHAALLPRLLRQVAPNGALALQVPGNFDAPAHRLMRELAASATWQDDFRKPVREWHVHEPAFYYDAVAEHAREVDLWTTDYMQVMPGPEAIVDWYKGTGLRPFLDALAEAKRKAFMRDYLSLITEAYPRRVDGKVLFPFLRLFLIAYV